MKEFKCPLGKSNKKALCTLCNLEQSCSEVKKKKPIVT